MSPSRYGVWLGVLLGAGIGAVYFLAETEPEKAVSPAPSLPVATLPQAPFMPPQLLEKRPTMAEDPTRSPPQSFSDGNRTALFQFALDELHVRDTDGNGRVIRIPPVRDLAGLRSAARAWEATEQRPADPVLYPAGLPRGDFTRRLLTRRVVIETENGFSGVLPAQALRIETPSYSPPHHHRGRTPGFAGRGGRAGLAPRCCPFRPLACRLARIQSHTQRHAHRPAMAPAEHRPKRRHIRH
jgi:hypothetical protein